MKINVWGCGYIGTTTCLYMASLGHDVRGVEIDQNKLFLLNSGKAPFEEIGVNEMLKDFLNNGRISFGISCDMGADLDLICVPTPNGDNGALDTKYIDIVIEEIKRSNRSMHIVVRSTVPVDYCDKVLELHDLSSNEFSLFPEFMREGDAIKDTFENNMLVVGCDVSRRADFQQLFLKEKRDVEYVSKGVASSIKMVNNTWHAVKISFANEAARLFSQYKVDYKELLNLFRKDTHLNVGPAYLKPGFAYGGSCLPKDSAGMNALASKKGIQLPLVSNVNVSNSFHIDHIVEKIELFKDDYAGVMIAGVSFKKGTNDIRMSPSVELCNKIDSLGLKVALRDDLLFSSIAVGENQVLLRDIQNRYLIYDSDESYSNWLIINIHKYDFSDSFRRRNTILSIEALL